LRFGLRHGGHVTDVEDRSRSEAAAAPEGPARRAVAGPLRALAGALLIGATAAAASLGWFTWRHRVASAMQVRVPYPLGDAVWKTVQAGARTSTTRCPPPVPVAVLYVSRSCAHCEAELSRWAGLIRHGSPQLSCVAIAVVAPYAGPVADPWLPTELARSLLWDRDGSIARALDARLVPVAAFVTGAGVVRERAVGEASEVATLERLKSLRWFANIERGGR